MGQRGGTLEDLVTMPAQRAFWRGRHVLANGHTGFHFATQAPVQRLTERWATFGNFMLGARDKPSNGRVRFSANDEELAA